MGYDTSYKLNNNKLYVHNFAGAEESVGYSFTVIDEYFKGTGYKKIEKVTQFYSKSFNVSCYINEDMKSAALFVDNLDMRKMHYLQVSIVAILPWFFKGRAEVTPLEMELICSLSKKSEDEYLKTIQKIASGYDFRSGRIKRLLEGFETQLEKLTLNRAKEDRTRIERDLESIQREFSECLKRRDELLIRILGLQTKIDNASSESEIMEYFLANKNLILVETTNDKITFIVKGVLTHFDPEMADTVISNRNSFVYRKNNIEKDNRVEKFCRALFLDCSIKMHICAAYRLGMTDGVIAISGYHYDPFEELINYIPNPHINNYSCMGDNQRVINELIRKNNDYVSSIEQCVASALSVNWSDSIVMGDFLKNIESVQKKCIELPNGDMVSPSEAINWIEREENNE